MNLDQYAETLFQETLAAAEVDSLSRVDAFTQLVMERLSAAGEFDGGELAYHKKQGVETSGWSYDDTTGVLHVFTTTWSGAVPPATLRRSAAELALKRARVFVERCTRGYAERVEESDPVWELADLIYRYIGHMSEVRLYLFADAVARRGTVDSDDKPVDGVRVTRHVWDLERLFRLDTSGLEREPIEVDLVEFLGRPLSCLKGPSAADHTVYLAIVPGQLVADLYARYGSRLLERNVRSFLQARGAVNKAIRETILTRPERFLAYNNGISATGADVSVVSLGQDGTALTHVKDLQIVNGGQTTASLHHAATRDKADLTGVAVQMKLTVVQPDTIDEIVPSISRFSNTQNKVTGADFSANHPFHVKVEELSRTVWAPSPDGSQKQTRWFYERARGQYADELARAGTKARQRQFKATCPSSQKFTKTDLAKFHHSWVQLPHVVSLGAEKNFREFMLTLEQRRLDPDLPWFQRLVALAILFRSSEKIVQRQQFGGYRAQIVTYTLAKLAHATQHRIDLDQIWRRQRLSEATADAIADLSRPVHRIITNPSGNVRHVGEWSKKLACWKTVEELPWAVPADLEDELIPLRSGRADDSEGGSQPHLIDVTPEQREIIERVCRIPGETWFRLAHWAKQTSNLQPWQRSLSVSIGRLVANGTQPTIKQAVQGDKLHSEAQRLGFR